MHFTITKSNPPMGFTSREWSMEDDLTSLTLTESINENDWPGSPTRRTDWMLVVDEFVSGCEELIDARGQSLGSPTVNDQPRWGSRASSRSSSISDRHLSHDGNSPGRRVLGVLSISGQSRRGSRSSRSSLISEGHASRDSGTSRGLLDSPSLNDRPRRGSRASSRGGSISEGHVSPDDDRPSRKVLHDDDLTTGGLDVEALIFQ